MTKEELLKHKTHIFGSLFVTANALQTTLDRQLEFVGLTSKQWLLLAVLEEFCKEEAPTLKKAAELTGTSHQNVKQIALKLEKKGFVELKKDLKDKRISRIHLCVRGEDFGEEYQQGAQMFLDKLFEGLEDHELKIFLKGLAHLQKQIQSLEE